MKIDLHIHTKKIKKGDPHTRNISIDDFIEKTQNVDIMAITNHNHFDINQYNGIKNKLKENQQLWGGVELDIKCNEQKTHLILVCDDNKITELDELIKEIVTDVEKFEIDIEKLIAIIEKSFHQDEVIFFIHYHKAPKISEQTFNVIKENIEKKGYIVFAEPSNYVTTSIMLNHSIRALNGSDVKNWDDYEDEELLELKIPVNSFKSFYLLAKKDIAIINKYLETIEKTEYEIEVGNDKNKDSIKIPLKNEVNIIFGGKGTGKTDIVEALKNKMDSLGKKVEIYTSANNEKEYEKILKINENENDLIKDNREKEILFCLEYNEQIPAQLLEGIKNFVEYRRREKQSERFSISETTFSNSYSFEKFENIKNEIDKLRNNVNNIKGNTSYKELNDEDKKEFEKIMNNLFKLNIEEEQVAYKKFIKNHLTEIHVKEIKSLLEKKKAVKSKPTSYGFTELINKRKNYYENILKIKNEMTQENEIKEYEIGELPNKGKVIQKVENKILKNEQETKNDGYTGIVKARVFLNVLKELLNVDFQNINEKSANLKEKLEKEEIEKINLDMLLGKKSNTYIEENEYNPSKGEKAILLIHHCLSNTHNDVYIFDEIEQGFENNYITEILIPKIKELLVRNKMLIIVTHNANIATHLYPFNTIYREYKDNKYYTYVGNMFEGNLVNINDSEDTLKWLDKTLITLEGSQEAFEIRGDVYGI